MEAMMAEDYKIREVHIEVRPGITVLADVSSLADLKKLLADLASEGIAHIEPAAVKLKEKQAEHQQKLEQNDDPSSLLELRAGLSSGTLKSSNVLAFKDDVPQLLRPNSFSKVTDATLVLLFAIEAGLKRNTTDFESFKGLYEGQNIKSGSPLPMLVTNLRNAGYLDKKVYAADRSLRLTAKGERKAVEVLKSQVGTEHA
jgi:hypothetical protein